MKYETKNFGNLCGCRTECTCQSQQEYRALNALVTNFSDAMFNKLEKKLIKDGYTGWDNPEWTVEDIKKCLIEHIEKGNPIDVANFCAFWYNRLEDKALTKEER